MRMLSKFVLAATMVAAAAPVLAENAPTERFVHDGYTYVYTVKPVKDGKLISGTRYPGSVAFQLRVAGNKVNGVSGGHTIAFNVENARGAAASAE